MALSKAVRLLLVRLLYHNSHFSLMSYFCFYFISYFTPFCFLFRLIFIFLDLHICHYNFYRCFSFSEQSYLGSSPILFSLSIFTLNILSFSQPYIYGWDKP